MNSTFFVDSYLGGIYRLQIKRRHHRFSVLPGGRFLNDTEKHVETDECGV